MTITEQQHIALQKIWFLYGNNGRKHTHCNHRFIQNFLESGKDTRSFYLSSPRNNLTEECIKAVDKILGASK